MLTPDEAKQIAEKIAWPHTIKELHAIRQALTKIINQREHRRETERPRRLPEYVLRVAKVDQPVKFKLGPVSAAELVAMTARWE